MAAYGFEQFLKTASNTFIEDAFSFANCATALVRIPTNHVRAVIQDFDVSSQRRYQQSSDRARIYGQFLSFKKHFETAPDRNGRFVYHFLCSVEALAPQGNEQLIFAVTAFIDADPESAIRRISQSMEQLTQTGMLNLTQQQTLALAN